jgi:hypothetical protein
MTNSKPKDMVRKMFRQVKNRVKEYNDVEKRVREATSNDPWPCTSTLMAQIANDANDQYRYDSMLGIVLKRLQDYGQIMHVKKAMILVQYLVRNAPIRFVQDMKSRTHIFEHLKKYRFIIEGVDKGQDIRLKAEAIMHLLSNERALEEQRESANRTRGKFIGLSYDGPLNLPVDTLDTPACSGGGRAQVPSVDQDSGMEYSLPNSDIDPMESGNEDEVIEQKPRQKSKARSKKKKSRKQAKQSNQSSLFDIDSVTGTDAMEDRDNWLADVAKIDVEITQARSQSFAKQSPALFDILPAQDDTDPFAPVNDPAPSPAPQQESTTNSSFWDSPLVDVTTLVHPHDQAPPQNQKAKLDSSGGMCLMQMAHKHNPVQSPGGASISHSNPFDMTLLPQQLQNQQSMEPLKPLANQNIHRPDQMHLVPMNTGYNTGQYWNAPMQPNYYPNHYQGF